MLSARTRRTLEALALAATVLAGAHLLVLLITGGHRVRVLGMGLGGGRLFPAAILLFTLLLGWRLLTRVMRRRPLPWPDVAIVVFSALMIVYLANGKTLYAPDTIPSRYLPFSILREGNFYLDTFPFLYATETPSYVRHVNGHYVSDYPVGAPLLALPVYLPSALGAVNAEGSFPVSLEKLAAAVIVAASAVVLLALLRRLVDGTWALVITAVYALASSSLSVSSQALWQHGASQFALVWALYCFVRARRERWWAGLSGLPLAMSIVIRPTDAVLVAPLAFYLVVRHPRSAAVAGLFALLPVGFHVWYNITYFGDALRTQLPLPFTGTTHWTTPLGEGLSGLLLSPGRGLIVYSPVFLFSSVGLIWAWRRGGDGLLRAVGTGTILSVLLYAKWFMWMGGGTYGPRYLADLSPGLSLALYPLGETLARSRALKIAFALAVAWSMGAHAIGAFADDRHWSLSMNVDRSASVWSWRDNQLVNPPRTLVEGAMIGLRRMPTSHDHPELVSAAYATDLPPAVTVPAPLQFWVEATNTGRVVWLAFPRRGSTRLGLAWRLVTEHDTVAGSGWLALRHNVFPGDGHRFWLSLARPSGPGSYVLETGLALGDLVPPGAGWIRTRVIVPD